MRKVVILYLFFVFSFTGFTQNLLKIDTFYSTNDLVDKILVGNGIRVGNVKLTGQKFGICHFQIDTNVIGMKNGILLSTGNVFDIARSNSSPGTSGYVSAYTKKYRSDKDLNKICHGRTFDQMILEFDFVPYNNNVSFRFSFASEEYPEYVGTGYNDVFAFIVTGDSIKKKNLALIPGTKYPITINNINQNKYSDLFIDNNYFLNYGLFKNIKDKPHVSFLKLFWNKLFHYQKKSDLGFYYLETEKKKLNQLIVNNFEYDGFTKVLTATCYLKPWQMYHLKIAIGDVGDAVFDSGVFLEAGSFTSVKDTSEKNFANYPDLSNTIDWDSIFYKKRKITDDSTMADTLTEEKFEVTNINFDFDKTIIPDSSKIQLDLLSGYLKKNPGFKCQLFGYTDNIGSKKYNQELSENRAIEVMNYLILKGIGKSRLTYVGNNFSKPIANNDDEASRALNRRVEIQLIYE